MNPRRTPEDDARDQWRHVLNKPGALNGSATETTVSPAVPAFTRHDKPRTRRRSHFEACPEATPAPNEHAPKVVEAGENETPADAPAKSRPLTDCGNAERFALRAADKLRFCHSLGRWFVWDGARWKQDDQGAPLREGVLTSRGIYVEAAKCSDDGTRAALATWARSSESRGRIDSMIALAKACPKLVVRVADLDADPWALNVQNGTVDLRTGQLRPHRRDDYLTKLAPVAYDSDATCPRWLAFLDRIFAGRAGLTSYVQRFLGHALTGDISEQILVIFFGCGANGKSALLDTVAGLMGDYASDAPPQLLTETKHCREHATEIADLMGRRLVVASESEDGAWFRLQLVKRLTGDATLKARYMRQDYFSFARSHKLVLVTNNRPRVREESEAVWRRLRLLPFDLVIPSAERDPKLLAKLREERAGILSWLIRGCLTWQAEGLGEPAEVEAATGAYRAAEDQVGRFLDEVCTLSDRAFSPWATLVAAYSGWCDRIGEHPMNGRRLGEALDKKGLKSTTRKVGPGMTAKCRDGVWIRSEKTEEKPC